MPKRQFSIRSVLCLPLIVLSCVLLFADCVKAESVPDQEFVALTAEQAAEINTVDNLLKSYKTITYAQLDYIGGYAMVDRLTVYQGKLVFTLRDGTTRELVR